MRVSPLRLSDADHALLRTRGSYIIIVIMIIVIIIGRRRVASRRAVVHAQRSRYCERYVPADVNVISLPRAEWRFERLELADANDSISKSRKTEESTWSFICVLR